jgi:hypothetical protein
MATARLGHADLSLRDHDVAWCAVDLIGQSPLPGNRVSPRIGQLPDRYGAGVPQRNSNLPPH